ncbi:MAG TPA: hypothetical protein VGQ76_07770 [Thermoanaerobaculia bacterium]|nr:hypothetical protein [Thermoanaerobaculia bacterium]
MRTYRIESPIFEERISVELVADEFTAVARAVNGIDTIVAIEEKLDILLENLREYEEELLRFALYQSHHRDLSWTQFRLQRHVVNRRILNVLSAARMYLDQVRTDVSTLYGESSPQHQALEEERTSQYDRSFSYRLMEVLRNHVQHHSLPVAEVALRTKHELPSDVGRPNAYGRIRHTVIPELDTQRLLANRRLKGSVVRELALLRHRPPLTPMLREYVGALGMVHERLRLVSDVDFEEWIPALLAMREKASKHFSEGLVGVVLVDRDGPRVLQEVSLYDEMIGRRGALRSVNKHFASFASRYAASEE